MTVRKELQAIAAGKPGTKTRALATDITHLTERWQRACAEAGLNGHAEDGEASQLGHQLSDARARLQTALDEEADANEQRAHAERLLSAADRETASLALEKQHRATAASFEKQAAHVAEALASLHTRRDKAVQDAEHQQRQILRGLLVSVGVEEPGEADQMRGQDLAMFQIEPIDQALAVVGAQRQQHIDARDAALAEAEQAHHAALAARADRIELALAEATAIYVEPLAAFVAAHVDAHGVEPALPDLKALIAQPSANDEQAEPVKRRFAFWR